MKKGENLGIWLLGARGSVATTAVVGLEAIRKGLVPPVGMVTELEEFHYLNLTSLSRIRFGGYEIREGSYEESAREIHRRSGAITHETIEAVRGELTRHDRWVKPGTVRGCGEAVERMVPGAKGRDAGKTPREIVDRMVRDLEEFRRETGCGDVVVVNVSSTEPAFRAEPGSPLSDLERFERALDDPDGDLPASVLYAYGGMMAGCPYVNFTPSIGSAAPVLVSLAQERGLPHMGQDGKTGETLLKTVLAPMFLARNLRLLSWEGHNILGNRDGLILNDPRNRESKLKNKDDVLRGILHDPEIHSNVRIDYVPSLDDWKTAWDFIHFQGFLGTKMSLQFIWQGCDSALAAPLVLDLARMAEFAHRRGESGWMPHLACFFKNPHGTTEHHFFHQFDMLSRYVRSHANLPETSRK